MPEIKNNKEEVPFAHYAGLYHETDPAEVSVRTGLPYDKDRRVFTLTLMNSVYEIGHPDFSVRFLSGAGDRLSDYLTGQVIVMRFLIGGQFVLGTGEYRAYRDMPWGEVYARNFERRCLQRLAYTFAGKGEAVAAKMAKLGGTPYPKGDIGWQFDFIPGLSIRFAIWNADDEFPPSAQILFSDNFPYAFTADDMAYVGDIFIKILSSV